MNKDWSGNQNSVNITLGVQKNWRQDERECNDYYATEPKAGRLLLEVINLNNIWECACGEGHLSNIFLEAGINVRSTDLIDRGFGEGGINFLDTNEIWNGDIVTNPPYSLASEFVEKAIQTVTDGHFVCMFLKLQFLEGKSRKKLFKKYPPKIVYVSSGRLRCGKNGVFGESAVAYAWFVWEKGFLGDPIIKWIN